MCIWKYRPQSYNHFVQVSIYQITPAKVWMLGTQDDHVATGAFMRIGLSTDNDRQSQYYIYLQGMWKNLWLSARVQ